MKGCTMKVERDGFCTDHLARAEGDQLWIPIEVRPDATLCGFCGERVWCLRRLDTQAVVALEANSHPSGRCEIIRGGFRVLTDRNVASVLSLHKPLYRAHGPVCEKRP